MLENDGNDSAFTHGYMRSTTASHQAQESLLESSTEEGGSSLNHLHLRAHLFRSTPDLRGEACEDAFVSPEYVRSRYSTEGAYRAPRGAADPGK